MLKLLEMISGVVWGLPGLALILGVGIYLAVRTRFIQLRLFPQALTGFLRQFRLKDDTGGVSGYQALCTALAATVGTGNLAGVAGAICLGGPGAIFWMWVCAFLGMGIKFAEATLAVHYRRRNEKGEYCGGPMQIIRQGMGKKWYYLASVYSFFGVIASFGVGNATQINAVLDAVESSLSGFGWHMGMPARLAISGVLAACVTVLLLGGAKKIGQAAERLVPLAAAGYVLMGFCVLLLNADRLPGAFSQIFRGAFSPEAVTGGVLGSLFVTVRVGAARGVFSNEAGMGTAAIAHASADVAHPADQGLLGIMEVFIDTIVICTMTALVILCSGVPVPYGTDVGVTLTSQAFHAVFGNWASVLITSFLALFAVATILGWGLYGLRCAQDLFGQQVGRRFVPLQGIAIVLSAVLGTGTVWLLAEIVNGLMMVPNLIAIAFLMPQLMKLMKSYRA